MNEFRLIIDPPMNAPVNMARDHAILDMLSIKESIPTLRIYSWSAPSVTLGYFQKFDDSVDAEYCRKNGIMITRRITGGGTVLHHRELTYSFSVPVKRRVVPESVEGSFKSIISPIIDSIRSLSINAEYRPVNDIVINRKKISGSAQVRRKGMLQQHGTLILDIEKELICRAIKGNREKLKLRGFDNPAEGMTSLCSELNRKGYDEINDDLIVEVVSNFSKSLNINFTLAGLSEAENAVMETYIKKFSSEEWNHMK